MGCEWFVTVKLLELAGLLVEVLSVCAVTPLVPVKENGPAVTLIVCLRTMTRVWGTVNTSSSASPPPGLPAITTLNVSWVIFVPAN